MVTKVQRQLFTSKWGKVFTEKFFQEKHKIEGMRRFYDCMLQKDSSQEL